MYVSRLVKGGSSSAFVPVVSAKLADAIKHAVCYELNENVDAYYAYTPEQKSALDAYLAGGIAAQALSANVIDRVWTELWNKFVAARNVAQKAVGDDYSEWCETKVVFSVNEPVFPLDWSRIPKEATMHEEEYDEESLTESEAAVLESHRANKRTKRV